MNVRFAPHNKLLAPVGGKDRTVFQWRLQLQPRQQEAQPAVPLPEVFVYPARQKRLQQDAPAPLSAPAAKVRFTAVFNASMACVNSAICRGGSYHCQRLRQR
jgi:hypothetical protein